MKAPVDPSSATSSGMNQGTGATVHAQRHASRLALMGASPVLKLFALVLVAATFHLAREILIPLALAVFLSFILVHPVLVLERWRLGRVASVCLVGLLALLLVGSLGWLVFEQMK